MVDEPFENNINTLLKNISSEIIRVDVVVNAINDEISSICSQIFE